MIKVPLSVISGISPKKTSSLYDMALKYCDVIPVAEALTYLDGLPANQG